MNRFDFNPTNIDISRSTFKRDSSVKLSFNVGDIIPFYCDEVLPGDTAQIKTSKIVRMQTLVAPVMDNIYLDTYYFYVPNRILWEHWKEFNGENTGSKWTQETVYTVPQITAPASTGWNVGTIADYFGIPTGVTGLSVNALPFRAYAMICDEWFRDQNNLDPIDYPKTDATVQGVNTGTFVTDVAKGGLPYKAGKFRDYFTSCLPSPQKGEDVQIGLIGDIDVYGTGKALTFLDGSVNKYGTYGNGDAVYLDIGDYNKTIGTAHTYTGEPLLNKVVGVATKSSGYESGLYADFGTDTALSVNALRIAFATQKMYEKDARGGTRYVEMIRSHFGVTSPDARQQRPEYLGGNRINVNINQVVQNSGEVGGTPQGNIAGYSVTTDSNGDFIKSFTEHGFIIGVCVARYDHTYQQGLERFWSRQDRLDYYLPVFANLGEQPVYNKEIYATGTSADNEVFGYQEAWADYRYKPSRVCGEMRSTYATSLDIWHLGDEYSSCPVLQSNWIMEDKTNIDRALQVTSTVSNQMFGDFYIQNKMTRAMPMYSIPGLIDHH